MSNVPLSPGRRVSALRPWHAARARPPSQSVQMNRVRAASGAEARRVRSPREGRRHACHRLRRFEWCGLPSSLVQLFSPSSVLASFLRSCAL
eukprot:3996533-Pleurochrysis_carterae.AAC.1